MKKDYNFDKGDLPYLLPEEEVYEKNYVLTTYDFPTKFFTDNKFESIRSDAFQWKELIHAKSIANILSRELKQTLVVVENYGRFDQRNVYIASYGPLK